MDSWEVASTSVLGIGLCLIFEGLREQVGVIAWVRGLKVLDGEGVAKYSGGMLRDEADGVEERRAKC